MLYRVSFMYNGNTQYFVYKPHYASANRFGHMGNERLAYWFDADELVLLNQWINDHRNHLVGKVYYDSLDGERLKTAMNELSRI